MNFLFALAMSALISASGWLNEGLKALEKKDYDTAIADLSKITRENSEGTRIYETALFYKAQAYKGKGEDDKAVSELMALLKSDCGKELRVEAKKLYAGLGGKPEKLLPDESPSKVWAKFTELITNGEMKKALEFTTGEWKMMLAQMVEQENRQAGGNFAADFAREITKGGIGKETLPEDPETGTAYLLLNNVDGGMNVNIKMGFVLDRESNRWLISSFRPEIENPGGMNGEHAVRQNNSSNINKLKQIGLGCRMYSQEHKENFPNGFDELKTGGYLENPEMYVWISPEDGSKDKFIYCPGHTESSSVDCMLAAAPRSANGKREALFMDGHVEMLSEDAFQKKAKEQGWKVPVVARFAKKDIPEEKQKMIRELVAQMGDSKPDLRQEAKRKLREMGSEAYPVLEEFVNHSDPEIKLEVKNILKGK